MVNLIYFVIVTLLSAYLAQKQKIEEPEAINAEDFSLPDSSQDREIPIIYGTVKVTGFNCIAAGDFSDFQIKKKVSGGMFSGSKKVVVGNGYRVGLVNSFGWGGRNKEIEMINWQIEDSLLFTSTSSSSFSASINNKSFFGPYEEGAGGMEGNFSFYSGAEVQSIDAYAASITNNQASQWRNISYMVWKGGYFGNNGNSVPAWQFVLKRIPKPSVLNDAYADVKGGANAVHVIYDLLTDTNYGASIPDTDLDLINFRSIAQKLYLEGWGLNMNLNKKGKISDLINEIMGKIDGSLNLNQQTGKFYIHLNRQDYVVADLPVFDESNIMSISNYSKNTFAAMTNQIKVSFTNKDNNFQTEQVPYKDPGLTYEMGITETVELDYSIITDRDLAYQVAIREIIPLSTNLFKCEIKTNRYAYNLNIGDCLILSIKKYKISQIVMRVAEIDLGSIDEPEITISLVQDKFGFSYDVYNVASPVVPPTINFTALPMELKIIEAPFYFTTTNDTNAKIIGFGEKPSSTHISFDLLTKSSSDSDYIKADDSVSFCPVGQLFISINEQSTSIQLNTGRDLNTINNETDDDLLVGDNLSIMIEGTKQEFLSFRTIASNTNGFVLTGVKRGLLDSIPQSFTSEAKLYVINYGAQLNKGSFTGTILAKAITRTQREELLNTTIYSLTSTNRKNRAISPSNLKINNTPFLSTMTISSTVNMTATWSARDRKNTVQFYDTVSSVNNDSSIYRVRIYDNLTNILVKSEDVTTMSYTFSDELALNSGVRFQSLRFEIDSTNSSSLVSSYKYSIILNR